MSKIRKICVNPFVLFALIRKYKTSGCIAFGIYCLYVYHLEYQREDNKNMDLLQVYATDSFISKQWEYMTKDTITKYKKILYDEWYLKKRTKRDGVWRFKKTYYKVNKFISASSLNNQKLDSPWAGKTKEQNTNLLKLNTNYKKESTLGKWEAKNLLLQLKSFIPSDIKRKDSKNETETLIGLFHNQDKKYVTANAKKIWCTSTQTEVCLASLMLHIYELVYQKKENKLTFRKDKINWIVWLKKNIENILNQL